MVEVGENVERNAGDGKPQEVQGAQAAPASGDAGSADAGDGDGKGGRGGVVGFLREIAILVSLALVLTFVTQTFLGRVYKIPSGSMEQTLHGCEGCTGDRVLVDKITYNFRDIRPGDVIVFTRPPSWGGSESRPNVVVAWWRDLRSGLGLGPEDRETLIKRVIAVGGQTVEGSQGRVLVDGKPLNEPYVHLLAGRPQADFDPVRVPEGQLWMMGDSRNNSMDSRYGDQGAVPEDRVVGKARIVLWPFDRWTTIDSDNPQG